MFVYQSRFLKRGEVWFDNEPTAESVDWILYRNCPGPRPGAKWRYFYNRLIDLSKSPEELQSEMEPRTLAKIATAQTQDQVACEWYDVTSGEQLEDIESMWNQSNEAKRRWGMLNRAWLGEMISARVLEIAAARDPAGKPLVYGGFIKDKYRVQQLLSVSPPREAITPETRARTNRASCLLLWRTMLRLREHGVRYFDFGGWYPGTDDIQLLGANSFKKSFGGQVVREFECQQIVTLKGWLVLTAARLMGRRQEPASRIS